MTTQPTAPAISADELGEAVGKIAGLAALSLHESFPHLDLDQLAETFTRPRALDMIGARFLNALDSGRTAGEAAADAGTALIRVWADARLTARAQLDAEKSAAAPTS
ncbi:hypothetical protein FSY75_09365 [Streptomyces sp. TR1341]|uniref:hypothetical protein n=1 Tax=Streptomyces sp. TR1341 TaxID=2601266 RepID=UPI00138AFC10|nr:hypothetical protein [Streptomyces sp. TR1341]